MADFVKMDRLNRLNAIVNEIAEERAQRFKGKVLEVSAIAFSSRFEQTTCLGSREGRIQVARAGPGRRREP